MWSHNYVCENEIGVAKVGWFMECKWKVLRNECVCVFISKGLPDSTIAIGMSFFFHSNTDLSP